MRRQDRARESGHGIPVVGEPDVPGVACDEHSSGGILQFAHVLAHGGLAQPEFDAGVGEAAGIRDGEKRSQQDGIKHGTPHYVYQ